MPITEFLERKLLFGFARAGVLGVIMLLVLVAALAVGTFIGTYKSKGSSISPDEVFSRLAPFSGSTSEGTLSDAGAQGSFPINVPLFVQRYFADATGRARLLSELEALPPEEQQEYVDNLGQIIQEAENQHINVENSINVFMQLRSERRAQFAANAERLAWKMAYSGAVVLFALVLIALCTLVLVLLAIERNTRPRAAA